MQAGPGFVDKNVDLFSVLVGGADDTQRRAIINRGERTGIAMMDDCAGTREQGSSGLAYASRKMLKL